MISTFKETEVLFGEDLVPWTFKALSKHDNLILMTLKGTVTDLIWNTTVNRIKIGNKSYFASFIEVLNRNTLVFKVIKEL